MNMREAGIILIEKDLTQKGWVVIRESVGEYTTRVENNKINEVYTRGNNCQWGNVVEQRIQLN